MSGDEGDLFAGIRCQIVINRSACFAVKGAPCRLPLTPYGQSTGTGVQAYERGQVSALREQAFLNRVSVDHRSRESGSLPAT